MGPSVLKPCVLYLLSKRLVSSWDLFFFSPIELEFDSLIFRGTRIVAIWFHQKIISLDQMFFFKWARPVVNIEQDHLAILLNLNLNCKMIYQWHFVFHLVLLILGS